MHCSVIRQKTSVMKSNLLASRFLPQIDYYINRDYMNDFKPDTDEQIKLIMNGWYSHRPQNFPLKMNRLLRY